MKNKGISKKVLIPSIIAGSVVAVLLIAFFVMSATVNEVPKGTIANNVYVGNIDVSGLTKKEAKAEIKAQVKAYQKEKVTLSAEGTKAEVTLKELGFEIKDVDKAIEEALAYGKEGFILKRYQTIKNLDKEAYSVEIEYAVDGSDVKDIISEKIKFLENEAKNATIKREGSKFVITDGKRGRKVELDKSVEAIRDYLNKDWGKTGKEVVALPTILDEPDVTREDLEKITTALGTFTTSFVRNNNRGGNIANATSRINGALLMPGDEYSASKGMGKRTKANGYREAGAYLNGKTVQEVGGGICQVSTTLYNAVILADLEIVERHPHSMLVDYVKPSMDAAISEGSKDLRFKNNTDAPIYIDGYVSGGTVTFTIFGAAPKNTERKVSYVSEVTSRTDGGKTFVASGAAVGTLSRSEAGHASVKSKLWKIVTENGVQVSKDVINSDYYRPSKAVYQVGIGTDNAEAKAIVQGAIASQNEATIRAAITDAKAIIAAAQQPVTPPTPPTEEEQTP